MGKRSKRSPREPSITALYHAATRLQTQLETLVEHGSLADPAILLPEVNQMVESLEVQMVLSLNPEVQSND